MSRIEIPIKGVCMKQSTNFELDVLINGSSAKTYWHDGRVYIEGRKGSQFSVRIKNNTNRRVLAILTVDGLSAIDGKDGSFDGRGYILDPRQATTIPGWRLNSAEVASFEFTEPDQSYAGRKGKGKNAGVIGCAFFYEREPVYASYSYFQTNTKYDSPSPQRYGATAYHLTSQSSVAMTTSNASPLARNTLGTGFGEKQSHKVVSSAFNRESSTPSEILTIHYDSREGLLARGVNMERIVEIASPFPKEPGFEEGFCRPPVGWNG